MADFKKALKKLFEVEFGNNPKLALHKVEGDSGGLTYKGIARNKNKDWGGWAIIDAHQGKPEDLENNKPLQDLVEQFYKKRYWLAIRGQDIQNQEVAENIFLFGVNAGVYTAIKQAQKIVGVKEDGIIGTNTIKAINNFDPKEFCQRYTALEKEFYRKLVNKNPALAKFLKGWENRAEVV